MNQQELVSAVNDQAGQGAYEAELRQRPVYHDGKPRRSWSELDDLARSTWCRVLSVRKA